MPNVYGPNVVPKVFPPSGPHGPYGHPGTQKPFPPPGYGPVVHPCTPASYYGPKIIVKPGLYTPSKQRFIFCLTRGGKVLIITGGTLFGGGCVFFIVAPAAIVSLPILVVGLALLVAGIAKSRKPEEKPKPKLEEETKGER